MGNPFVIPESFLKELEKSPTNAAFVKNARALNDTLDDEVVCRKKADLSTQGLDASIEKMSKEWRPTGFYKPDEMTKLITATNDALVKAAQAIDKAVAAGVPQDIRTNLYNAKSQLQTKMQEAVTWANRVASARASGLTLIDAPTFKSWVLQAQAKISAALFAVAYTGCLKPGVVAFLQTAYNASTAVLTVAKEIVLVGVDTVKASASLIGWLAEYRKAIGWTIAIGSFAFLGYKIYQGAAKALPSGE